MISQYEKSSKKFINYRNIYKYLERIGFLKDELQFLYDDICEMDAKLKAIDASVSHLSDGGRGSYPGIFEQWKIRLFRKFRKCL